MAPLEFRSQVEQSMPTATGDAATMGQWVLDMIDAGRIRLVVFGPAAMAGVTTSFTVVVDRNDASLQAAADRWVAETKAHKAGELVERIDRTLAIGPAIRLHWTLNPTGGALPSQTLDYLVRLADGRTLALRTTSVAEDTGFEDLAERILATFTLAP